MSIDRETAATGDVIEIVGEGFGDACNDTIVNGTAAAPPLGTPTSGIRLVIAQDDASIPLGSVDADASYGFGVRLAVPPQLHPGTATVRVEREPIGQYASAAATFTVASGGTIAGSGPTTTVRVPSSTAATTAPTSATSPGPTTVSPPSVPTSTPSHARLLSRVVIVAAVVAASAALLLLVRQRRAFRRP